MYSSSFGSLLFLILWGTSDCSTPYVPTWESIDSRPLPSWYDNAKFGIFLHWGVYSVPGLGEWFWANWQNVSSSEAAFMKKMYPPGFTYQEFAPNFKAEFFNATKWAEIFKKANAKYVVLTSKHHEGFTMWPSKHSFSWNAKDVGPHRDIVHDLSEAVRNQDMIFGLYYSLYEWFNPLYNQDKKSNYSSRNFVDNKMWPELKELIYNYRPDVIWADGDWEAEDTYWKSREFLAWLYNESPIRDTVVVNDRWGSGVPCKHGGFYSCADRYKPGTLQPHKWESCITIEKSKWGFRKNAELSDYLTVHEIIEDLVTTVSCGGNLLLNVGPTDAGMIAPIFQDRLEGVGKWLDINGEAIFHTKPWLHQNDSTEGNVWYTSSKDGDDYTTVYAHVLKWPRHNQIVISDIAEKLTGNSEIFMLGNEEMPLKFSVKDGRKVFVMFPDMATVKSHLAWVLKIINVKK